MIGPMQDRVYKEITFIKSLCDFRMAGNNASAVKKTQHVNTFLSV
jgi:hypothetical protein